MPDGAEDEVRSIGWIVIYLALGFVVAAFVGICLGAFVSWIALEAIG